MMSIEKWGVAEGHAPFFDVVTERVGRGCRTGELKRDRSTSVPRSPQKTIDSLRGRWQRFY